MAQFGLEPAAFDLGDDLLMLRVTVGVLGFVRIIGQIVKLPPPSGRLLGEAVVIDQLVLGGADAVMGGTLRAARGIAEVHKTGVILAGAGPCE